ncbi:c-type cytochrome [Paenibacillus arenilitoris]|uniref:Cytochrome c n=1 Tax=Paenibacillus arenilitoris TaxID=2772299 RepID=A0A927CPX1_9BACL|nr:cytochrome c [Paenibacillus arenilitoris]MBD2870638.1 cytochrome c [Paenibacillus arenilitoris]
MKRKHTFIWTAVIVLAIGLTACGGNAANDQTNETNNGTNGAANGTNGDTGAGDGGDAVNAAEAESLYAQNCVSCHAADLSGGMGPDLQHVGAEMSVEEIHAQISNGGNGMPAYKGQLPEEQIAALSEWLAGHK